MLFEYRQTVAQEKESKADKSELAKGIAALTRNTSSVAKLFSRYCHTSRLCPDQIRNFDAASMLLRRQ